MKLIGWHSETQAQQSGEYEYTTPAGGVEKVTGLYREHEIPGEQFPDARKVGEVLKLVRTTREPQRR